MSTLYITEYAEQARDLRNQHILAGKEPAVTTQTVTFTATAGHSAAFNANTTFVRLQADGICSIRFGTGNPTAVTTDPRMAAGVTEFFGVTPGSSLQVSAVTNT